MTLDLGNIEFPPTIVECLEALAQNGTYGDTPKEVVKHLIQYKVFLLDDVKRPTIHGLLLRGKSDGWIIRNVPGPPQRNKTALKNIREDSSAYPLDNIQESQQEGEG